MTYRIAIAVLALVASTVTAQDKKAKKPPEDPEAKHYRIVTIEPPKEVLLEVARSRPAAGRQAARLHPPRRDLARSQSTRPRPIGSSHRYAAGLHEPLGIHVEDDHNIVVIQRPELTKISDRSKNDIADEFTTICDSWGISGGYHEYAFGPAKDKAGNFFVTLNVGFSGGGQSPVPWRGWAVKIDPQGKMEPWAYGLRSPNGITFAPQRRSLLRRQSRRVGAPRTSSAI